MKFIISAIVSIFTTNCLCCEIVTIDEMKKDIEKAFFEKTFSEFSEKYGYHQTVELTVENEYNEEKPIEIHEFSNMSELNKWFWKHHKYSGSMIIPEPSRCSKISCEYELPKNTLHHGVYFLGFQSKVTKDCSELESFYIYWG